jgi:acyl carrier protein
MTWNLRERVRAAVGTFARREPSRFSDQARLVEDLGIPSAKRAELTTILEAHLGRRISDAAVSRAQTVDDLLRALA